jgi:hypothetical protein
MEIFFWVVFEQICDLEVWNWYPREGMQMAVFCVHFTTSHGGAYYIGSFTGTCISEDFTLLRFAVIVRCNQLTLLCHSQHLKITPFLHAVFNLVKVQGQPQLNLCTSVSYCCFQRNGSSHSIKVKISVIMSPCHCYIVCSKEHIM